MFTTRKGTENGLLDVYINKRSVLVKEIGNTFKERREEIGIKLEEAAGDLEITVAQLENLEDGNINAFKDIFFLKELIKKYATYLNVNEEELFYLMSRGISYNEAIKIIMKGIILSNINPNMEYRERILNILEEVGGE